MRMQKGEAMAEYVNEDKPIIIKNETDSDFNVGVGVVFRKSGIYEITITDSTITVTKISERKTESMCADMDDVIGREAAINALSVAQADLHNAHAVGLIRAQKIISDLPSAPQRTGHWIDLSDSNLISGRCSACGWESYLYEDDVVGMDFCPHCGARMEGAE